MNMDFYFCFQMIAEVEMQKLFIDVDKKKKKEKGITLSVSEWRNLSKATQVIDAKIAKLKE